MENKSDNQGKDITDEKSGIVKMIYDIKIMIFEIVKNLLKEEPIQFWWRTFLIFLETTQVISYVFESQIVDIWKNPGFINVIQYITRYTRIVPFIQSLSYQAFSIVFFLSIFFLTITLFALLYIIFAIRKKAQILASINSYLRYFTELICSILFIPLFELFLIAFKCSESSTPSSTSASSTTGFYHIVWTDVQCYTGNYIAFVLLSALFSFIVFIYTFIMTLIFFECRLTTTDCYSKSTARGDLLFFIFKVILVIGFTLLNSQSYQIIIVIVYLGYSTILFNHFCFNLFYNHYYISKIVTCKTSICMWTSLMLVLAKLMESYSFDGTPFLWIIGIPFISVMIIIRQDQIFEFILINSNNYEVLSQPMNQLVYLTKLLNLYHVDKSIAILIDGFLDFHRSLTSKEDSHIKRRVLKTTKLSKILRERGESEQVIMVIAVLQGMYYYALQKFPNNTRLRILYSLFLLDKILSKQQALQELLNAELERPSFDELFIIHRYKSIIENSLMERTEMEGKKGDNFEMVNELSIQNHLKQCRLNVEKSANLHMEFWSQLSESQPDLGKLSLIGYKINVVNQYASEQWNKLQLIDANIPSIMRLYAKYMIEILNDKEGGESILIKLGDINARNTNKKGSALIDLSSESKPTVFISAEDDSFGIITNVNLAASGQLGYNKMEILNRNVKVLMPALFSKYHDNFIETYLSTLEPRILNSERNLPGKDKLDYIVPIVLLIRHVPSLIHGLQFVAQFKIQKTVNLIAYVLINTEGQILNLTSTCINVLSTDQKRVNKKKVNIVDVIPDFWNKIKDFQSKNGSPYQVKDLKKKSREFYANVQAQEISFRNAGKQGYYIKIEKLKQHSTQLNPVESTVGANNSLKDQLVQSSMRTNRKNLLKHFQVKYDLLNKKYTGELCEGPPINYLDEIDVNQSQNYVTNLEASGISNSFAIDKVEDMRTAEEKDQAEELLSNIDKQHQQKNTKINFIKKEPKYGLGIKTVRLIEGQLRDIEDLKNQDEDEENSDDEENMAGGGQNVADSINSEDNKELGNIFKKRSNFLQFTSSNQFLYSNAMRQLRIISILLIVALCSMSLLNHFLTSQSLNECMKRYEYLSSNNQMIAEGQRILMKITQMCSLNEKIIQVNDQNTYFQTLQKELSESYDLMSELQTDLSQVQLDFISQHNNMLKDNIIVIKSKNELGTLKEDKYNLNDVTRQILSVINTLKSSQISKFKFSDQDIFKAQQIILTKFDLKIN